MPYSEIQEFPSGGPSRPMNKTEEKLLMGYIGFGSLLALPVLAFVAVLTLPILAVRSGVSLVSKPFTKEQ